MHHRRVAEFQCADDAGRCQGCRGATARAWLRRAVAGEAPGQHGKGLHEVWLCGGMVENECPGGEVGDVVGVKQLASSGIEALGVQDAVDVGGTWVSGLCMRVAPGVGEPDGIGAAAFEAGAMAGRKGGRFVEEEQLGVPAGAMTSRWRPLKSSRQQIHWRVAQRRTPRDFPEP